jgi:hypothetical protein
MRAGLRVTPDVIHRPPSRSLLLLGASRLLASETTIFVLLRCSNLLLRNRIFTVCRAPEHVKPPKPCRPSAGGRHRL